ncbi:Uncharacterised protein [uncultured archaeon]|nr:Uncharacterised protein [uncultured archaeon]
MIKPLLASLIIFVLISGCVENVPVNITNNITNGTTNNTSGIPEYQPVIDLAKKDLAARLNITAGQIQLARLEKVDWPDTSLGYPEKGKMYAQMITPGFRIVLEAGGRSYEYHGDFKRVIGPVI